MSVQTCKKCGETFPLTREHFGNTNNRGVIGWRGSCRGCMRAVSKAHSEENPEQYAERRAIRAEREREAGSAVVDVDLVGLRRKLGDRCRYCDDPLHGGGEVDHLTPVARGGSGRAGNVTICCMPCNRAKLAKTLQEFMDWRRDRGLPVRDVVIAGEAPDRPTSSSQRRS